LELDHVEPRALGGRDDAENLRVRCRAHNQLAAEQVFGRDHVEQRRRFRQKKCGHGSALEQSAASGECQRSNQELGKVRVALRRLGFGHAEARRAVAEVEQLGCSALTIEEMLRRALLAATRAA
jgi:Holliday junction resolvasome RuvABC DNA-binding subunit